MMTERTIALRTWRPTNNAVCHEWIFREPDGTPFRVSICRGVSGVVSFARIDRWDGAQWHTVANRPISMCSCFTTIRFDDSEYDATHFADDCRSLRLEAIDICGLAQTHPDVKRAERPDVDTKQEPTR